MKKIINLLSFCALVSFCGHSQTPEGEFYQIVQQYDAYFEQLKESTSEEEFYSEGGEYKQFQRWLAFWEPRVSGHGDFDVYYQAVADFYSKFAPPSKGKANTDDWEEIGPFRRSDLIGVGPVYRISIFEPNPNFMLLSTVSSGIFYSNDEGESWQNSGTDVDWPRSPANDAVFHPTNAYIWFGISKHKIQSGSFIGVAGIQHTGGVFRKGGLTSSWLNVGDYNDFGGNLGIGINKLLFDKRLNSSSDYTLFAATTNGVYRCDNVNSGSPTWSTNAITVPSSILSNNPGYTFGTDPDIYDLEYQLNGSSNTDIMYATMRFRGNNGTNDIERWRVMISYDNGITWAELPGQTGGYDPDLKYLTVETSRGDNDKVWCLVEILHAGQGEYTSSGLDGIVKEYSLAVPGWTTRITNVNERFGGGNAFGIDQVNAQNLAIGFTLNSRRYTIATGTINNTSSTLHADNREFVYHPTMADVIWCGNDGGISKSTDGGATWVDKTYGLGVAEIDDIADSKLSPDHLATAIFHNHCGVTSTDYTGVTPWDPEWDDFSTGDGTKVLIDPVDEDVIYGSGQGGSWRRMDGGPGSSQSSISLASQWWSEGSTNSEIGDIVYRVGTYNGEGEIYRSFDKGANNTPISDFQNSSFNVYSSSVGHEMFRIVKSSPVNPNHLYAIIRTHDWRYRLFVNKNVNDPNVTTVINSWEQLPLPRTNIWISGLAFDENDENVIYISYSQSNQSPLNPNVTAEEMVFRMDYSNLSSYPAASGTGFNCGSYPCEDITMNLPNTFADFNALVYERGSNQGMYVATDFGVYYTNKQRRDDFDSNNPSDPEDFNNTNGWVKLGNGLPHVNPRGLLINYKINRLRIGLDGRGLWEHDLQCPNDYNLSESGTYSSDEWIEVTNNIESVATVPNGIKITYRAGNEIRLKPGFHSDYGSDFHAFIHGCDRPGNSFKIDDSETDESEDQYMVSIDAEKGILIYPNPSTGVFNVTFEDMETASIELFNLQGQAIPLDLRRKGDQEISFDLSGMPKGIYILNLSHGEDRYVKKIILR